MKALFACCLLCLPLVLFCQTAVPAQPAVNLELSGPYFVGEDEAKGNAPSWDDMPDVPMYWVHQNKAIRSLYEITDEWTVDSFVLQKWLYPSTRTECGYPMYGYKGKDDITGLFQVLDRRGNVSFDPNLYMYDVRICPSGSIFSWTDKQKNMFEIYGYEKHGIWKEIPIRDTLTYIVPTESGLVYIGEYIEGGSWYYGDLNATDTYRPISLSEDWYLYNIRFTSDMSRMVCIYGNEGVSGLLPHGSGIAFFNSQYNVMQHYDGYCDLFPISPDGRHCVLSVKEDTYLTDINGNIIRKYEGLLTRNLVWSPSGDSFWMSGYIVNARNGEIIGKVNDSPYTCAALFDMDSHRIAFADGNMIHVIDYQTQEKLLFIDNKEISYDTTVVTLSGDGRECTAYMELRSTPDIVGTVVQRYHETGVSHE